MKQLCALILLLVAVEAGAERAVLDLGGKRLDWTAPVTGQWRSRVPHKTPAIDVATILQPPLSTSVMKPGRVYPQTVSGTADHPPFFVLGDDPLSIRWLGVRKKHLVALGARAVIVSVPSAERLAWLRRQLSPLESQLLPGDALAQQLNLDRYPVLIHRGEAVQ